MKKNLFSSQGFTLIELLISISIMGILLAAVSGILNQSLLMWKDSNNKIELQQTARAAVDSVEQDMAYAQSVQIINASQIVIVSNNQTIIYSLSNGILKREVQDGSNNQSVTGGNLIETSISNLVFTPLVVTGNSVRTLGIDLTATDGVGHSFEIKTAITANNVLP